MANLAPIIFSADDPRNGGQAETINADAAPSLNAAFAQIHAESGIKPIVLRDLGGDRTEAQQAYLLSIGKSDTLNSDHRGSDFPTRAAADIDNITKLLAWNSARFKQIMADHGWHNMTNTGAPFPTEDWHYAKHGILPAGDGSTLITDTPTDEDDMKILTIDSGKLTESSFLIGQEYIHRSPDPETTSQYINLYGSFTHPVDSAAFQRICWSHGVQPATALALKGGQAWSAERGTFNPGDNPPNR